MTSQTVPKALTWRQRTWGQRVERVLIGTRPPNRAGLPWWQHLMAYVALFGIVATGRNLRLLVRWCLLLAVLLVIGATLVGLAQWIAQAVSPWP